MNILKNGYIIVLALVFSLVGMQQTASAQTPVDFGIRGGLNFANYSDVDGDLDSRSGLLIGAYVNISLPMAPFSIQPEVAYSQKGASANGVDVEVDYLEVPVLAKFSFAPGPASPHIYVGPYVGFVVEDDSDSAETDFGGMVGAGLDINAGVVDLNLGARYGLGFVDAFENGSGKNSVFSIVAGVSF